MVSPYCLDEKSETPQGAWVLSFLYLNSMTAALRKSLMTHDLMSCLDWAFLNPSLKKSAVSTIWGSQCPPRREKGNPMAEP